MSKQLPSKHIQTRFFSRRPKILPHFEGMSRHRGLSTREGLGFGLGSAGRGGLYRFISGKC